MKDHRLLLADCAQLMRTSILSVIYFCICMDEMEVGQNEQDEAHTLYERFIEKHIVPVYVEDFCLSILLGEIPVLDDEGKKIN